MQSYLFSLILVLSFIPYALGQNAVEDLSANSTNEAAQTSSDLFTETILNISPTKRIFILTNKSGQLSKGDFVSMLIDGGLAARAVVAKNTEEQQAGIKILKIYSLKNWNRLRDNIDVQIIRGDDSYYQKAKEKPVDKKAEEEKKEKSLIGGEEDLYNETSLNDGLELDENSKRAIKTDNVFGISYGQLDGVDATSATAYYPHFMGHWAYQFMDNVWFEAVYGQSTISDFPDAGLDTKVANYTGRIKYTFSAPFYSYILPYVGYQYMSATSPGAGQIDPNVTVTSQTQKDADAELTLVNKMQRRQIVVGATILKRLVPGWFLTLNLGTDMLHAGFALEF